MMEGGSNYSLLPVQIELLHQSPEVLKLLAFCYNLKLILDAFATAQGAFILYQGDMELHFLCVCYSYIEYLL